MKTYAFAAALALLCSGCASVVNESTHPIKIETLTPEGAVINGANCQLSNDYGSISVKSGDTNSVHRSSEDLEIVCKADNQPDASARVISRTNSSLWGNVFFAAGIGALVDHSKGTAYSYPNWVQLVFGKSLVFDRSREQDGRPTQSNAQPSSSSPAQADTANKSSAG